MVLPCKFCIEENFPFGKLGKIAFGDITNNTSIETPKTELTEFTTKKDFDSCCPICNKRQKNMQFHVHHVKN